MTVRMGNIGKGTEQEWTVREEVTKQVWHPVEEFLWTTCLCPPKIHILKS